MKSFLFFVFILSASAESLHYSINWPSGLSLGEATLDSTGFSAATGAKSNLKSWDFKLDIDASVPGFVVRDNYKSMAADNFCTVQLDKSFTHGKHKSDEHLSFDQQKHSVSRETRNGGGKSETDVGECARDPLTFIQFLREELAHGRIPPQQNVIFGAAYSVRVEFTGAQPIKVGEQRMDSDRVLATIKGPSSDLTVEIFFSRDAARVPLMAKIPLSLGTFSVELQQ